MSAGQTAPPARERPSGPWLWGSIGITAAVFIAAAVAGFAWLPTQQQGHTFRSMWDVICSAAGVLAQAPASQVIRPSVPTTHVALAPDTLGQPDAVAIGRGATLALRCTMCHGARGLSQADSPNLAGQYALAIYKQLADFKSGARASSVMAPLVAGLSDSEMRELAVYYAYLPREVAASQPDPGPAPAIVASGAPMRGIAPCGACHGGLDSKAGASWLNGQPVAYLRSQLQAFASGARRNDVESVMRNVAQAMTSPEIDEASRYYAGH
jgi:cytochrome c553